MSEDIRSYLENRLGAEQVRSLDENEFTDAIGKLNDMMRQPLSTGAVAMLRKYYMMPTEKNWEEVHGIGISNNKPRIHTVWQNWLEIDSKAPRKGGSSSYDDKTGKSTKLTGWEHIPDKATFMKILKHAGK